VNDNKTSNIPIVEGQEPQEVEFDQEEFDLFHRCMVVLLGEYWKPEPIN
jgi:hypothetical protein